MLDAISKQLGKMREECVVEVIRPPSLSGCVIISKKTLPRDGPHPTLAHHSRTLAMWPVFFTGGTCFTYVWAKSRMRESRVVLEKDEPIFMEVECLCNGLGCCPRKSHGLEAR